MRYISNLVVCYVLVTAKIVYSFIPFQRLLMHVQVYKTFLNI